MNKSHLLCWQADFKNYDKALRKKVRDREMTETTRINFKSRLNALDVPNRWLENLLRWEEEWVWRQYQIVEDPKDHVVNKDSREPFFLRS